MGHDDRRGELDGHGTIPADLARAIALSAATINTIAINPACGTALDLGRISYRPRLAQKDHVTTRDQTCRFPGCRQPAHRCQLDHSDEYCPGRSTGGTTCPCNLACLCVFHHNLKTSGLWDTEQHPDGTIIWTSPTRRTYETRPRQWPTCLDDNCHDEEISQACHLDAPDDEPPPSDQVVGSPCDHAVGSPSDQVVESPYDHAVALPSDHTVGSPVSFRSQDAGVEAAPAPSTSEGDGTVVDDVPPF